MLRAGAKRLNSTFSLSALTLSADWAVPAKILRSAEAYARLPDAVVELQEIKRKH